jgi:phosphoribosylformimino-5-aminoimidazole carboxamide ribonucleotide (ProFAR) isomerase
MLAGPDIDLLARVRDMVPDADLIASGGVGSLGDLQAVRNLGADAAVVGRALYEGRFTYAEAAGL